MHVVEAFTGGSRFVPRPVWKPQRKRWWGSVADTDVPVTSGCKHIK